MKFYTLTLIALLSIFSTALQGQLIAGEVPENYTLFSDDIDLIAEVVFATDTVFLDLNNDAINDIAFGLTRGPIETDGINSFSVALLHDDVSICVPEGPDFPFETALFEAGTVLSCNSPSNFSIPEVSYGYMVGAYGGWSTWTYSEEENLFVYYDFDDGTQQSNGWIEVSFDLNQQEVSASINGWIVKDFTASINQLGSEKAIKFFPNPVQDGLLYFQPDQRLENYSVYNLQGQLLKTGIVSSNVINLEGLTGMVLVHVQNAKEHLSEVVILD